jgi:hypothetical protein
MKKFLAGLTTAVLSLGLVGLTAGSASAEGDPPNAATTVAICHATGVDTYEPATVLVNEMSSHLNEPGDVIPAFSYDVDNAGTWELQTFDGQNLGAVSNTTGEYLLANACVVPVVGPAITTLEVNGPPEGPPVVMVDICHWDQSGKWTAITLSSAALGGTGHIDPSENDTHAFDIVEPFDGYLGKNYNDTSDNVAEYKDDYPFNGSSGADIMVGEVGVNGQHTCGDPEEEEIVVTVNGDPTDESCSTSEEGVVIPGSIQLTVKIGGSPVTLPNDDVLVEMKARGESGFTALTTTSLTGLSDGTYMFKVTVDEGYTLTTPKNFSEVIADKDPEDCTLTTEGPIDPKPTFTPATCQANGSYTLTAPPSQDGLPSPSVFWYVNDVLKADGTYSVVAPASITVKVVANDGYTFLDFNTEVTFDPYQFTVPTACGLTTLALTGASDTTPALALTAFLGLLGLAMVRSGIRVNRNRQEA